MTGLGGNRSSAYGAALLVLAEERTGRFPDEWRSKQTFNLPRRSGPLRNGRQARVMTRRATHHSLECKTESALRFVPQPAGDGANGFAAREPAAGEQHAPAGEIFDRSIADQLPKSRRETGARHPHFKGQRRHRPAPSRLAMDGCDRRAYLLVGKREQPADAVALVEVEAERLNEDHVDELLDDQEASRFGLAQLLSHPVEGPAQCLALAFPSQMD